MTWQQGLYVTTLLIVILCLSRAQRNGAINLFDLVTANDRHGIERTDSRKFFECGAFVVTTVAFSYLVLLNQLTEIYLAAYMAAWVTSRFLRDREQRLNRALEIKADAGTPKP